MTSTCLTITITIKIRLFDFKMVAHLTLSVECYDVKNDDALCTHSVSLVPYVVGAQKCRLATVDAHTVALQSIHGKITRNYSRYCAVAFYYVHKCELSYIYPGR